MALPEDFGYVGSPTDAHAMREAICLKFLECWPKKGCIRALCFDTTDEEHVKALWQSVHDVAAGGVQLVEDSLVPVTYT